MNYQANSAINTWRIFKRAILKATIMVKIILCLIFSCFSVYSLLAQIDDGYDKQIYSAGARCLPNSLGFNLGIYQKYGSKKYYGLIFLTYSDKNLINSPNPAPPFSSLMLNKRKQKLKYEHYINFNSAVWKAKVKIKNRQLKKGVDFKLKISRTKQKAHTLNFSFRPNEKRYISLLTTDSMYILIRHKDTLGTEAMFFLRENRSKTPMLIDTASYFSGSFRYVDNNICYLSYDTSRNNTDTRMFMCGDTVPKFFILAPKAKHEMFMLINTCDTNCKFFVSIGVSFYYSKILNNIFIDAIKDMPNRTNIGFGVNVTEYP